MKILINERLSEHRCKTPEGYLICTDAILARTGKQTYRKNEIFKDSDDETEIEVDRTEDEVFSPQTLASFENKPVTVEHPDEDVNVHNYKEYAVGFVRDVHRGDVNGQPVILGNLVITDEQTIQEIENGEHTDLSCGYDCDIADEANPCQRNIRGNHVALCECGRAGIARIIDSDVPRGYKVTGNNYAWELAGTAKDKKEAANKFVRKYPELENIWGISELLNFMIQSNKDVERDTELGYALHFDYDEYTKKFYIAFVEKKYRYDDSIKDAQHRFEVCYINYDKYCVVIEAKSTDDAVAKFRRKYGMYHIVHVKQIDSMKNIEDNMKKYAEDKHGRTFTLEEIKGGKVKATNMSGREKIFSGWKEAEEEFRKRGITILDSFYDIVEDSVKDAEQTFRVLAIVPGDYDDEPGFDIIFNVKANSENEAITKAKKYAEKTPAYRFAWDFRIAKPNQHARIERNVDSANDAKYVIMHPRKNLYLTVGAKTWSDESDPMIKKFDSEKEAEEYAKKNTSDFKIAVFDSVNDALIPPTKGAINKFEALLRIFDINIDRKGLTPLGRVHYQVRADTEFDRFVARLERIDEEMDKIGVPMTFNAGSDGKTCTAGIDLDKQYVKDSQRAQKIQKIIKVVKSIK